MKAKSKDRLDINSDNNTPDGPSATLPRTLGVISATAVLVGTTIGSGIFRSPASIATRIPNEPLFLIMWVVGGLFTLCGALTYAELSSVLPQTGGVYVYLREGFGRPPAFLFGWSQLTILRASALGAIATVFSEYLIRLLETNSPEGFASALLSVGIDRAGAVHYLAAISIVVIAVLNVVGVNISAALQNTTATAKFIALILLVLASFVIGGRLPAPEALQNLGPAGTTTVTSFGLALISVLWVYDGWADLTFVSGEVKRPERNLPFALIAGTAIVIGVYLLTNLAYLHLLDINQIGHSKLVAADTAFRVVGGTGVTLVSLAVMISAFGTLNGSMLTGSRIFFAMSDDGLFFKKIAAVHPKFKTPHVAISLAAVLAVIFVMVRSFEQLADTFVLGIWPFYAGGVAAVYTIRKKRPDIVRPYKALGYPVTPALFLLAATFLVGNAVIDDVRNLISWMSGRSHVEGAGGTLLVFAVIATGIPAYWIWQATHQRKSAKS